METKKQVKVISAGQAKKIKAQGLRDEKYCTGKFSKTLKEKYPVGSFFETHIDDVEAIYLVKRSDSYGGYYQMRCLSKY